MKTKNVKLKFSDIKHGASIHIAHPIYGIESGIIMGKPFQVKPSRSWVVSIRDINSLFSKPTYSTIRLASTGISLPDESSLAGYNGCRSFRKLKHAQEWQKKWLNDPSFVKAYKTHKQACSATREYDLD